MGNAALRNTSLPKVYRRVMAMAIANANANGADADSSLCPVVEGDESVDRETEAWSEAEAEARSDAESESREPETKKSGVSGPPPSTTCVLKPTPGLTRRQQSRNNSAEDVKKPSQRQSKACTGPIPKDIVDEGIGSALSDDDDIVRIHAANRKAWPRGQEPISAHATVENREIAELVRRGLIGVEPLQVDHDVFDEIQGGSCSYTLRFVEAHPWRRGKKGKKGTGKGVPQKGGAVENAWDAESDWWYLDDEAYSRLLSDGGTELLEWSETSSFVRVD
jgi:hypothetical protein